MKPNNRRQWRQHQDDQAEARWHDRLGDLFGLDDFAGITLPPAVIVGWTDNDDNPITRRLVCLPCLPSAPAPSYSPVYHTSYLATKPCAVCGRRLDHHVA